MWLRLKTLFGWLVHKVLVVAFGNMRALASGRNNGVIESEFGPHHSRPTIKCSTNNVQPNKSTASREYDHNVSNSTPCIETNTHTNGYPLQERVIPFANLETLPMIQPFVNTKKDDEPQKQNNANKFAATTHHPLPFMTFADIENQYQQLGSNVGLSANPKKKRNVTTPTNAKKKTKKTSTNSGVQVTLQQPAPPRFPCAPSPIRQRLGNGRFLHVQRHKWDQQEVAYYEKRFAARRFVRAQRPKTTRMFPFIPMKRATTVHGKNTVFGKTFRY